MQTLSKRISTRGFTLVELSIILVILAIFAAAILSTQRVDMEDKKVVAVAKEMERIRNSIAKYVEKNGFLPCPARRDLKPEDANFGVATNCSPVTVQVSAGIRDFLPPVDPPSPVGVATNDTIRIGMVPIKTLGLSDAFAFDEWNNRYTYVVIKRMAIDSAQYSGFVTTVTNGLIKVVKDSAGTQIAPTNAALFNPYVIFSHGPDAIGAYNVAGQLVNACSGTQLDIENCDEDNTFIDTVINDTATGASYYYDFLSWSPTSGELAIMP